MNAEDVREPGTTALMAAVKARHSELTRLLLEAGADTEGIDSEGRTALLCAQQHDAPRCMQLLLEHHADTEARDVRGNTVLLAALRQQHLESLRVRGGGLAAGC